MQYTFSLAKEADAPAVYALLRSLISTGGCTWSDAYPTYDVVLEDVRQQSQYLLKDSRNALVAAAFAGTGHELLDLPWNLQRPCELARVAVSHSHQNQGVGSCLLQQIIPAVQARGFDGICMLVSHTHPHALRLYEKNGFTRCGEVYRYDLHFFMYSMSFRDA